MLFLGLIVFYLYYNTRAYCIPNSPLEIASHNCTSYLPTLQLSRRLADYPCIWCSTIVVPWDIKLFLTVPEPKRGRVLKPTSHGVFCIQVFWSTLDVLAGNRAETWLGKYLLFPIQQWSWWLWQQDCTEAWWLPLNLFWLSAKYRYRFEIQY